MSFAFFKSSVDGVEETHTVHVRWLIRQDMRSVTEIENHSFEYPWSETEFITALRQRNCIGMVAEINEQVVGFMVYELHKARLEVLSIAVHQDFRKRGVGKAMIYKLISKLSYERRNKISLMVRESNLDALNWLKRLGFRALGITSNFYEDSTDDAIQMRYWVGQTEVFKGDL